MYVRVCYVFVTVPESANRVSTLQPFTSFVIYCFFTSLPQLYLSVKPVGILQTY